MKTNCWSESLQSLEKDVFSDVFSVLNHIFLYGGRRDCAEAPDRKAKIIYFVIPVRFPLDKPVAPPKVHKTLSFRSKTKNKKSRCPEIQ
jgi:hypothetical protein